MRPYDEIMVDEYQDTNEVQNAIFNALSREGTNLFLVGDVKQSIYRFRLADPTIFLGKYRAFADYTRGGGGGGAAAHPVPELPLPAGGAGGANFVFRGIMSAEFGEMDYTADEALYPGAPFSARRPLRRGAGRGGRLRRGAGRGRRPPGISSRPALRPSASGRWWTGLSVSDGEGGRRPVRPADIVILLRSPNTVLHHYARALGSRTSPGRRRAAATSSPPPR